MNNEDEKLEDLAWLRSIEDDGTRHSLDDVSSEFLSRRTTFGDLCRRGYWATWGRWFG